MRIYAAQTADHLRRGGYDEYGIDGEVYLWGTVVEHQIGWRAEFAYPKALYLPKEMLPITLKQIQSRIEALIGYGCDICIAYDTAKIPLWRKDSGFDGARLDFLTSRSTEWYAQRKDERTIKTGSRVAILGRGIAVVQRVGAEQVHAVLWNKSAIKIDRRKIKWDEQNMRWERQTASAPPRTGIGKRRRVGSRTTCGVES